MLPTILGGSAIIVSLVALYYTNRAYGNAQAAIQALVAAEIIRIEYVNEEDE